MKGHRGKHQVKCHALFRENRLLVSSIRARMVIGRSVFVTATPGGHLDHRRLSQGLGSKLKV